MAPTSESLTTTLINSALACLLLSLAGSTFALGIFTVPVELAADPPHVLDGVWQSSMGLLNLFSGITMIFAGLFLDSGVPHIRTRPKPTITQSKTIRVRALSLTCLLPFVCLEVAAIGAATSKPLLIIFGVSMQAFPLGVAFFLCAEVLLVWNPQRSGLAMGCGQMSFGLGTIFFTQVFDYFIRSFGFLRAIHSASLFLSVASLLPTILMSWPCEEETRKTTDCGHESEPLLTFPTEGEKIPLAKLLRSTTFWLYIFGVLATGASFMFNPYYFKIGLLFNRSTELLVLFFQLSGVPSVVLGLFGAWITDFVRFGNGFWFSGAKNMMMAYMVLQVVMFLSMVFFSNHMYFWGFMLVKTLLKLVMTCYSGGAALLAKDLFGKKNTAIVFGVGAGLALGLGDGISAWLTAWVESSAGTIKGPNDYNLFYWLAALWSFLALIALVITRSVMMQSVYNTMGIRLFLDFSVYATAHSSI